MLKKISFSLIILIIIVINLFRFWRLDQVPYGYNVDELSGAVTVACMETEGVDAHLHPHPIFSELHYGTPKPPIYTYPAALWAKIFGAKADSLRASTAFCNVLTILGLFFLARLMLGNSYALLVALLASLSPWLWGPSRVGYEATSCVTFFIWGMFFFLRSEKWPLRLLSGFLFACSIYAYAPARLQVPILLATLFIFNIKKQNLCKRQIIGFFLILLIACIPLIHGSLYGNLLERFKGVSIFNTEYLQSIGKTRNLHDISEVFIRNYVLHFSPEYLFTIGDPSWEHSTRRFGILSWVEVLGLVSLLFFLIFRFKDIAPHRRWLIFIAANFFLSIVPASLTNSDLHISLRTISALPFECLLSAYGLWLLYRRWEFFLPITAILSIVFAFFFLKIYFTVYPEESKGWFSYWTMEEALNAKTDKDWIRFMVNYKDQDYHFRYYLMHYRGESCSSSRAKWIKLREVLGLPKAY